jgi:hypothetical protein
MNTSAKPVTETEPDTATDNVEDTEIPMRILRVATCPSLSGRSDLTYHVGCHRDTKAIALRLWSNTAAGMFSKDWISMADISQALSGATKITSASLQPLYAGTSRNNAGFMLALLKGEGIVASTADRGYECLDPKPFLARTQRLIASGVDLNEDDAPSDAVPMSAAATPKRGRSKKQSA